MKKLISFVLAAMILLALCSCGKIDKSSEENIQSKVTGTHSREEFKDSKGRVVSVLESDLPELSLTYSKGGAAAVNKYFEQYKNEIVNDMEKNADSVSEYLDRFGFEAPRTTKITYEIYYETDSLLSLILKTGTGSDPETEEPDPQLLTFSLITGSRLSIKEFLIDKSDENYREEMLEGVLKTADRTYSPNNVLLSEDKKELIRNAFLEDEFVVSEDFYTFAFSLPYLSDGSREGYYYCDVPSDYVSEHYINPAEYAG